MAQSHSIEHTRGRGSPERHARAALWRSRPTDRRTTVNVTPAQRAASVGAGAALLAWGLARRGTFGVALGLTGAALVRRGVRGHSEARRLLGVDEDGLRTIARSITIARPIEEVHARLRELDALPRLVPGLASARREGERVVLEMDGARRALTSRIVEEVDDERVVLRSTDGDGGHEVVVRFARAPGERGAEVHVAIAYRPRLGVLGAAAERARLSGLDARLGVALRRAKQLVELGTIVTTEGQTHGKRGSRWLGRGGDHEEVAR